MAVIQWKGPQSGYMHIVGPDDSDLDYVEFGLLALSDNQPWEHSFPGRESVLVILGGHCDVAAGAQKLPNIGRRADVFDGKPAAIYLPPGSSCQVTGRGDVEIAVCSAIADKGAEAAFIPPDQVGVRTVGTGTFQREIYDIVVADTIAAQRLLVGETYNPPGLWSSYPPHKHDVHEPPAESKLEEVYHFRVKPGQGFGIQRVYGEGFDETYAVHDRDTVTINKGYHPVAAAPGYRLYYLWILAGEERIMHPREDPDHAWVPSQS